jgi:zinc protease
VKVRGVLCLGWSAYGDNNVVVSVPVKCAAKRSILVPASSRNVDRIATGSVIVAEPATSSVASFSSANPPRVALAFEKYVLPNGLEVILHEDHRTPVVAVNIWYHVGAKDEGPGRSGFAHLFEHVMFQGSRNVGEDKFFFYLERAGASDRNGSTNFDRTNYYETVPSGELGLVLWLESDRMGYLLDHANERTFLEQREVVKNERRQRIENASYGFVGHRIYEVLFPPGHPYHRPIIGLPEDLDAAKIDDVRAFFRRYYVPSNATLVIAGDFQPDKAKELVAKYFGGLPRGADPGVIRGPLAPPPITTQTRLDIEADVMLPRLVLSWVTPHQYAPGDAELDIVSDILSAGKSSRLFKRLVYDLQLAQSVGAYQRSSELASVFDISVTLLRDKRLDEALKIVDEELDALRSVLPKPDEVERARTRSLTGLIFGAEKVTSRADSFNLYNRRANDPAYFEQDQHRYENVQAADVMNAVSKYLRQDNRVVTFVHPTVGAPRAGRLVAKSLDKPTAGPSHHE